MLGMLVFPDLGEGVRVLFMVVGISGVSKLLQAVYTKP